MLLQYYKVAALEGQEGVCGLQEATYWTPFLPRLCLVFSMPGSRAWSEAWQVFKICNSKKKKISKSKPRGRSAFLEVNIEKEWHCTFLK